MKIKEIEKTANIAWSPAPCYPVFLAAGTAAQQLDATFRYNVYTPQLLCIWFFYEIFSGSSTSASLDIYSVNFAEHSIEMPCVGSIRSEARYVC